MNAPLRYPSLFHLLLLISIIAAFAVFPGSTVRAESLPGPDVFVSSDSLSQGDTLLIVAKNETGKITGSLGAVKLRFFRDGSKKNWVAITGMTVDKKPGTYKLSIKVPGKAAFEKDISVAKRDFPVTTLEVTPELSRQGYTAKNIVNNVINKENTALAKVLNVITPTSYVTKPFVYPLSSIKDVGAFGNIRKSGGYAVQHLGTDLQAPLDTPVYAVNDGKAVFVKSMTDYGNTVVIDHGLGVYSLYLHLDEFKVKKGQAVERGDVIGLSGDTGYALAPHLHFSIKMRGASLDPLNFIEATRQGW
jgi:murein DD-endopeptidase MepM/ murein hydrolase activator NlpD